MGGITRHWYAYQYTGGGGAGASSLLTNLISYWKLDEVETGTPVTRVDSVVISANDLTDNNTTASAAGKIGNAATFVAANSESLSHADNASLEVESTDFTFSCWVQPNDLAATYGIAGKSSGAVAEWVCYILTGTGSVHFQIFTGAASQADLVGATITAAAWHFVIVDYVNSTKAMSITVDNGAPATTTNAGTNPTAQAVPFVIGNRTGAQFLNGLVDECGFWKRILTAGEKSSLWNGGAGLTFPF